MNDELPQGEEQLTEVAGLDNFDTRTPAQIEADNAAAADLGEETEETAETEEESSNKSEEEKTEEKSEEKPAEEAPKYQPPQKIALEAPSFEMEIPRDEYGNIDPEKFGEYLQARDDHLKQVARIEAQNAFYEQTFGAREWADVEAQHGELLKSNPDARETIESLRIADAVKGGQGLLMDAANKLDSMLSAQKQAGIQSQQTTITKQKSVALKSSTRSSNPQANKMAALRKQAFSGDGSANTDAARREYIAKLYESGALGN